MTSLAALPPWREARGWARNPVGVLGVIQCLPFLLVQAIWIGLLDTDFEVDVDVDRYCGCFKWASKSVQILLNGIETVLELTLIIALP